jgi:hypothetical protein
MGLCGNGNREDSKPSVLRSSRSKPAILKLKHLRVVQLEEYAVWGGEVAGSVPVTQTIY